MKFQVGDRVKLSNSTWGVGEIVSDYAGCGLDFDCYQVWFPNCWSFTGEKQGLSVTIPSMWATVEELSLVRE